MSNKSKRNRSGGRRNIRPHERARVDQVMAAVRDVAARDPKTRAFFYEYADPGVRCCWCDCPDEKHQTPGYVCSGCVEDAVYLGRYLPEKPGDGVYPLCEQHRWGVPELHRNAGGRAQALIGYDGYDGDIS
jgi:hypothetical protein